jgi:uncharacterized protein (TIGR02646 family)
VIAVKRGRAPDILADVAGAAADERTKVLAFYDDPANTGKNYKFRVYSHDSVKEALERLFRGKCAYCESRYAGTQPMDVEHWRPKGGVLEDDGTALDRGYYWLASEWENLLPSCIDCNRERRQRLADLGMQIRSVGKAGRFPIAPGSRRATKPGEEKDEKPLLLHPAFDRCEDHFEYTGEALIRAKTHDNPAPEKAEKSIEVYALNRSGLVEERRLVLMILKQRMATIDRLATLLIRDDLHPILRRLIADLITHEITELRRFGEPARPFSAMARQFIDAYVAELRRDAMLSAP